MLPQVESRVGLSRGDGSAMNQPRSNNTAISSIAGLTSDLADASFEIVKQRQTARALREASDLMLRQDARLKELSQNSAPGESVVEAGMEQFVKEANDFISAQPSYLRDAARAQMLRLRDSTASNLLSLEANLAAEELAEHTAAFTNNTLNGVRYGSKSEKTAFEEIKNYSAALPERIKGKVVKEMQNGVKIMALDRLVEENPYKALEKIQSGNFNDLDPYKLAQIEGQAQRGIEKIQAEFKARQKDSIEHQNKLFKARAKGDFFEVGLLQLQAEGFNEEPTRSEILGAQLRAGVLPTQLQILMPEEASIKADIIAEANSLEEFKQNVNSFLTEYTNEEERNIAIKDLQQKSGMGSLFSMMLDDSVTANLDIYGTALTDAMFDVSKEPRLASEAIAAVTKNNNLSNAIEEIDKIMAEIERMAYLGQSDPTKTVEQKKAIRDSLYVATYRLTSVGKKVDADMIRKMYDGNRRYTEYNGVPISRVNANSITDAGIARAIKNRFDVNEIYIRSPQNMDENGNLIPFTKKDNPALYDTIVSNLTSQALLAPVNPLPSGEYSYRPTDALGVDTIYEVFNGKEYPVYLTESDLVKGSQGQEKKKERKIKSIREGF